MNKLAISIAALMMAATAGWATMGAFIATFSQHMVNESEINRSVRRAERNLYEISRNSYNKGCLQGFETTCKLLKKKEQQSCVGYSRSYCLDASAIYATKVVEILGTETTN